MNELTLARTRLELLQSFTPFVELTVVESTGSAPQKVGASMLVFGLGGQAGTIGGGRYEYHLVTLARKLLEEHQEARLVSLDLLKDLGMSCGGRMTAFLQPHHVAELVHIFGAGHCARALAPILTASGFRLRISDHRPDWASQEGFPEGVQVVAEEPGPAASKEIAAGDWVLIMTSDHSHDLEVLREALKKQAGFIGVMASRTKAASFRKKLSEEGPDLPGLAEVEMPIGLPIMAQGPAEIAVSIAARLIQLRRSGREAEK